MNNRRFERKIGGRLFLKYYSRLLQFLQSVVGFGSFFLLIIHIKRGKLHFGLMMRMRRTRENKPYFTYKKL